MHHHTYRIIHTTACVTPVVEHWLELEIDYRVNHEESIRRPIAPCGNGLNTELQLVLVHGRMGSPQNSRASPTDAFAENGAICSFVVKAFAHGSMGRRIDRSWGGPTELFLVPASAQRLV